MAPCQTEMDFGDKPDIALVVEKTTRLYRELSIDIPKIVVLPKGDVRCRYKDFNLDVSGINLQPVSQNILIQHLHDRKRHTLQGGSALVEEKRPEDYLVRGLIDFDDISYDHADILYKLGSQMVNHLRGYLRTEEDVLNVLQFHQQTLVKHIHAQMQDYFFEEAAGYEAHITKGFHTLRSNNYSAAMDENVREFRLTIPEGERNRIKSMLFGGFKKCLYPVQKFDSDSERRFALVLENDRKVQKWFKPSKGDFRINYTPRDSYEPDFVVEAEDGKYLCEPKRSGEMTDETVLAKARAAAVWCANASDHAKESDGKTWKYILIPHDQITEEKTFDGFVAGCFFGNDR